ncbi:Uu.00g026320.m01.CDS01 [Anthostomella pinea]|uniref:Uu.00g026320.m01.CDS01 n=1 Tax=Anthostomella pinea TaxID=933095 RepID=A0AAI8V7D5_9PEZI|nr:Uu.00g026320.m01.CDS01 [Anthostomella pinea]
MVKIPAFEVEQWMDKYENTPGVLNIAETCASSISVRQLIQLNDQAGAPPPLGFSTRMTYGAIRGSEQLRRNIADTYADDGTSSAVSPDDIIVTQGAISANHLVFYSLVGPGDHVVCVFPTYQQLYSVPESLGAEVSLWELKAKNGFIPDVAELEMLVKVNTKMIVINNPNNPTGAIIPKAVLTQIIEVARKHDIIVFSDEVYRPLFHGLEAEDVPPSALSLGNSKVVVTSSTSKAWALAGIRVGWVASRDPTIIEQVAVARDYTTISVSQLDDQVARYALGASVRPHLLKRNMELARTNLGLLERFVKDHPSHCFWIKPTAGTTAFVQFLNGSEPVDDDAFCRDVLEKTKVMFVPGARCFGPRGEFKGFVRIGYVSETEVLQQALERLGSYIKEHMT